MAFEPQRFLHAANIRLDVPVSVQTSETLSEELRFAFEDATLFAFDEVIETCIRRDVDFLLLSGNVFIEADRSLRARLALLKAFNKLNDKNIHVFVVPGDADPPEAWRAIPELPDNVTVCYSSDPEPKELFIRDQLATTVSTSMWLGKADDFGIRVLAQGGEEVQPFRIGVVSRAKYEESLRMASMAASASDETLAASLQNTASGEKVDEPGRTGDDGDESTRVWRSIETEDGERPRRLESRSRRSVHRSVDALEADSGEHQSALDPGFIRFIDEMLREGQLNYLALTSEMARTTVWRDDGVIHCPGTTQSRSQFESAGGACSLVEVSASGDVSITSVDTSCVDWKQIEVRVTPQTTLSSMLQQMKTLLTELRPSDADRIWSVQWILRGALPILEQLAKNDLDVAAAVELDELRVSGRTIRLLHDIRSIPTAWPSGDPPTSLADQYQLFVSRSGLLSDDSLQTLIHDNQHLTSSWKQRLTSLLPSIDPEQILARIRTDGAAWFSPDFGMAEVLAERDPDEIYEEQLLDGSSSDDISDADRDEFPETDVESTDEGDD